MARFVSRRTYTPVVSFWRNFDWMDRPGAGFSFEVDESGALTGRSDNPDAARHFAACLTGIVSGKPIRDLGVERREGETVNPAVIACDACGAHVSLYGFTNTCECGADYNMSGSRLAPREQWGEETGETADEILRAGSREYWEDAPGYYGDD